MDTEKKLLLEAFTKNHDYLKDVFDSTDVTVTEKSADHSEDSRDKGNELFKQKHRDAETHIEIFRYYCQSIAFAPSDSEVLAKAYANRSAFLLYMQKFEECLNDIHRALNITNSEALKIMLLCRKVECIKKLAMSDYQNVLDEAETHAKDIDSSNKARVDKLISKVKACSIGNPKISRNQNNENSILSQLDETLSCISIEHNEKYGRHLVAKKDYNPGDFIFRDDLYVTLIKPNMIYTNCIYCLKICWSGVPCDHCCWVMFCSEDSKKKAQETFHGVECSVIPNIIRSRLKYFEPIEASLRLLVVGIQEAGGIDELKDDLKKVDQSTDIRYKGFYKNDQFTSCSIQSVYSLESSNISKLISNVLAMNVLVTLIAIVKHSTLIKNIKFDKFEDIIANENLVFLGSLLIKFSYICINNIFSFSQMNCDCQRLKRTDYKCCDRGTGISALASLISHSCNPNTARIFTEDQKINVFALQPIKKGSQIFFTYAGFYYNKSPGDRKRSLREYNFRCECEACLESWPPLFLIPYDEAMAMQSMTEKKLHNVCKDIYDALDVKKIDFHKNDVAKLCKTIVQAKKRLTGPTFCMAALEDSLLLIYSRIYGWKSPIHAFGKCSNASKYYVALIQGKVELPSLEDRLKDAELPPNVPKSKAHELTYGQWVYFKELADAGGIETVPDYHEEGLDVWYANMRADWSYFKQSEMKMRANGEFEISYLRGRGRTFHE